MDEPDVQMPDSRPKTHLTRLIGAARAFPWVAAVAILLVIFAVGLRVSLVGFRSLDYFSSLKPWYNAIRSEGFSAFATGFSNYNPPFLYLLYLAVRWFPDAPPEVVVKLPALVADFLCAVLVFWIVRFKHPERPLIPFLASGAALFAPTVVLNSAFWGQADSLFTSGILACVALLMWGHRRWAMVCFGIALAFKLQAVFVVPLVLALALRGSIPWRSFLAVPAVLVLAVVPAWIAGRPLWDLLTIYVQQASQYESITMNAPSVYAWLPGSKQVFNLFVGPGVIMGLAVALLWSFVVYKGRRAATGALIPEVALLSVLMIPFFLPKMHERYFYPADLLSIAVAFLYPRLFWVPVVMIGTSFASYQPFLFEREIVPLPLLTFSLLTLISVLTFHSLRQLYSRSAENSPAAIQRPTPDPRAEKLLGEHHK